MDLPIPKIPPILASLNSSTPRKNGPKNGPTSHGSFVGGRDGYRAPHPVRGSDSSPKKRQAMISARFPGDE